MVLAATEPRPQAPDDGGGHGGPAGDVFKTKLGPALNASSISISGCP